MMHYEIRFLFVDHNGKTRNGLLVVRESNVRDHVEIAMENVMRGIYLEFTVTAVKNHG
jgi:hypothetical protein